MSQTWMFEVDAGPQTFELRTGKFPTTAAVTMGNPSLTAQFVPLGGLPAAPTSLSSQDTERIDGVRVPAP